MHVVLDLREFMGHLLDRRTFLALGGGTAISAASARLWGLGTMPMPSAKGEVESKLDAFTADYMQAMNAPGMTQALTDTKTNHPHRGLRLCQCRSEDSGDAGAAFSDRLHYQVLRRDDHAAVAG